ncbi:MAG: hypothetical protein ACE5GA_07680, partial [Candidatus Zixiibacteriota bacterium]
GCYRHQAQWVDPLFSESPTLGTFTPRVDPRAQADNAAIGNAEGDTLRDTTLPARKRDRILETC